LLQTLEIHDVITMQNADKQRFGMKRAIRDLVRSTRSLATGLRRRMNELSAKEGERGRLDDRKDFGATVLRRSKFKVQQPLISRILSGHRQEHIRRDRETMHA